MFTSPSSIAGSKLISQEAFESLASFLEARSILVVGGKPYDCPVPAAKVFSFLTDHTTWKYWEAIVPKVDLEPPTTTHDASSPAATLHLGSVLHFGIVLNPSKPEKLTPATVVVDGLIAASHPGESYYWTEHTTDYPGWISIGRRIWRIEDLGPGKGSRLINTDYQCGF
jgi:hypothetical protein